MQRKQKCSGEKQSPRCPRHGPRAQLPQDSGCLASEPAARGGPAPRTPHRRRGTRALALMPDARRHTCRGSAGGGKGNASPGTRRRAPAPREPSHVTGETLRISHAEPARRAEAAVTPEKPHLRTDDLASGAALHPRAASAPAAGHAARTQPISPRAEPRAASPSAFGSASSCRSP